MTKRVEAIEYDHTNTIIEIRHFEWAQEAIEWCEGKIGEMIKDWDDTQIGLRYAEYEADGTETPGRSIFEIHGYDEKTGAREIEQTDWNIEGDEK